MHHRPVRYLAPWLLGLSIWCSGATLFPSIARTEIAQTPQTAPMELKMLLAQIDAAANSRNLKAVMQFYDRNFIHADGMNRNLMERLLREQWERSSQLNYKTEIESWQADGEALIVETVTRIAGIQEVAGREMNLNSTIRSRQQFVDREIVRQEILTENTRLTAGENPPTVTIKLPEQVTTGERYNLDVIVEEPLGNDLLLGAVNEEPVRPSVHFNRTFLDLELLSAGGIFKRGIAPGLADNRWISAVLVRGDGITMITRRLRVVEN